MKKLLSIFVACALLVTPITPMAQAESSTNIDVGAFSNSSSGNRSNLVFLDGNPGDTHLVYTYSQNGKTYQVEENASADFKSVNSKTYILDASGNLTVSSTQEFAISDNGNAEITIENNDGQVEKRIIDMPSSMPKNSYAASQRGNYDWVTTYRNGSTAIDNLTISVIIATITSVATLLCSPVAGAVVSGVSSIATAIFNANANYVYYYKIYNWRHSDRSYFLIEETEWTQFYLDSSHTYSLGHSYYEWLDE